MLFNSTLYLLFFPAVYLLYWNLKGNARQYLLILASVVFYAAWGLQKEGWVGLRWTFHFTGIIVLNYWLIRRMLFSENHQRTYLTVILLINAANLFFFKYTDLFIKTIFDISGKDPSTFEGWNIFLPLAISFYTFQLIAYAVDAYRGLIQRDTPARHFFLFILFFPQLIAGPIMRSSDFMDQIDRPSLSQRRMLDGLWLITGGLIKKIMIADPMGNFISPVFAEPWLYSGWSILFAGIGFSIQVYGDFSGYTDLARGSAKLLGYDIPENFLAPFFSRSARELWQRWHITLASWLRDYIYFPLGGSRVTPMRSYLNLFLTFTLGGLWHGADYTFIAWGAFWGFLIALERYLEKEHGVDFFPRNRFLVVPKVAIMFLLFSIGAIMFRSRSSIVDGEVVRSGEIMIEMLTGLFLNGSRQILTPLASSGVDLSLVASVFGPELFSSRTIPHLDSMGAMLLGIMFFHWVQYRPSHFEPVRRFDYILLPLVAAIFGGYFLPLSITDSHQFIYFVF